MKAGVRVGPDRMHWVSRDRQPTKHQIIRRSDVGSLILFVIVVFLFAVWVTLNTIVYLTTL